MMICIFLLFIVCIIQLLYIRYIQKQIISCLSSLKSIKNTPQQKIFTKDKGLFADINFELNAILEENRKRLLQLKRAENANKQILTNLSHDVRTPLASLTGYLEALDSGSTDEVQEYIHVAFKKAIDLKEFIDMLFEWFKLNSNERQYSMKDYDINELTRELIIEWLPEFDRKKISLTAEISDDEWFLWIDKIAYKRIMNNLIQNAVHHGKCSHITIRIQKNDDTILIAISNDGITIPSDKLPYVFERLYKCDTSRSESGNGLGLAIAKELTMAMSGEITAASIPEKDTTFFLLFSLNVREK